MNDVDEPNVKIHLDTYHMNIEERSLEAAVVLCGDRLGYVHVGESDRGALGMGNVDFDSLFRGLRRVDYDGPITFESFSGDVVSPDLSDVLCIWRNPWGFEQRDELAVRREIVRARDDGQTRPSLTRFGRVTRVVTFIRAARSVAM